MMRKYPTKLAQFLDERGIKQKEIGRLLGLTQQQVSKLAGGINDMSPQYMKILAEHYGLPRDYFLDAPPSRAAVTGPRPHERPEHACVAAFVPEPSANASVEGALVELITMAIDVLRSRTHYADSLEKNIRSFHRGVARERVASERAQRLEERVDQLEWEIRRIAHLGPPGEHAEPFPPPGAPEKSGPQDARPERGPGSSTE